MFRFGGSLKTVLKVSGAAVAAGGFYSLGLQSSSHNQNQNHDMDLSSQASVGMKIPIATSASAPVAVTKKSPKNPPTQEISPEKETRVNMSKPFYTFDNSTGDVTIDPTQYRRIDEEYMLMEKFKAFQAGNALHDTLFGLHRLEKYEIYKHVSSDEVIAVVRFGDMINGHPTIVHGGITSLVFDNTFGWLFFSLDLPLAVTANLNVNYRAPLPMNTTCILQSKLTKLDGRKMFMNATLHDLHGKLIADSTSLFISLKPSAAALAKLGMKIKEYL